MMHRRQQERRLIGHVGPRSRARAVGRGVEPARHELAKQCDGGTVRSVGDAQRAERRPIRDRLPKRASLLGILILSLGPS